MVGSADRKGRQSSSGYTAAPPVGDAAPPVSVVCIGAIGQSGSTLLTRMLGQVPGFVAVGETGRVWDKGLGENMECGCGQPFRSCDFWSQVGEAAFGGWGSVDAREATRLRDHLTLRGRAPHPFALPLVLWPRLSKGFAKDLARYASLMHRLYAGISEVSGGSTIVDSMKQPAHVYMMSRMQGIDVDVVHIVRDPRGVAYSKTKWIHRQGARSDEFRVRRKPPKTAEKWTWMNLSFDALPLTGEPVTRVTYEALVGSPEQAMSQVLTGIGRPPGEGDLGFIHGNEVVLSVDHFAAGSRMRLQAGPVPLVLDEVWRRELPSGQRRLVTALSLPLLRRYGYPVRTGPEG